METLVYDITEGVAAFSTKRGEPCGSYGSFNITHYCGDAPEHVTACRAELCATLGIPDEQLILPRQTHGCKVLNIDEAFMAKTREEQAALLQGVDAVTTALPRICIGVSTADCVPVLLCDTERKVVAATHAGWRGTVARITEKSVAAMQKLHGCKAQNIRAVIAPSIGPGAFEVGDEVYEAFHDAGLPVKNIARRGVKWHIDLWEANRLQLLACGLAPDNIHVTRVCTHTHHEEFFSARRLGINSGRIFNGIMIE